MAARFTTRVKRVGEAPIVAVRLWLRGGARLEDVPGQALLTGRLLAEGTRRRDWREIARESDDRGMLLQSLATYESIGVTVDALAEDWRLALDWAAELALEPSFPEDRLDWLRRQALGELESLLDQPEVRAGRAFLEQLYTPHPYGRALQGDAESLGAVDADACAGLHRRALEWGGLLVVAGRIDEAAVESRAAELFGSLAGSAAELPPVDAPRGLAEAHREVEIPDDADQAHLYAGHLTVPRRHPDTVALAVLAVVLGAGAGMSGRLPERIREREGLAYHVDAATYVGAGLDAGRLVTYAATSTDTAEAAERAIREELTRLVDDGLDQAEFEEARSYLIGRDPFRRETARQWADILAEAEFYGLETDRPEWVTERLGALERADVEAAARRWIRPSELRVTVGRPR
ncbi:MAG TPA: pitrilysin family protein [Thermoanaerobaculia bacterium]|jgi:zinc protease